MANPGMDPVHTTKFHIADMPQRSCLLTSKDTPPHTPHPVSRPINYRVGAKGSQIRDDMVIDQSDPDHARIVANQLQTLVDHWLIDKCSRAVEVLDSLGNVCPELLVESTGIGIAIGSGEPSPESSNNRLDRSETFAFGNNGSD